MNDLADKESAEITVLEAYLPPALDAAALEAIVDEAITDERRGKRKGPRQSDEGRDAEAGRSDGRRQARE